MSDFDDRLQQAGDYLAQAGAVLDELERGLAVVQRAEDTARRTGRHLLVAGAVVLGSATVIVGVVALRRLLAERERDFPPRLPVEEEPQGTDDAG
jgi:hypothetical protein